MQTIKIPKTNKVIGGGEVFIVAELGKGFIQAREEKTPAEYLENAKQMVKAAKEAGVDAVKFQTHNLEDEQLNLKITSPHFMGEDRYAWVKRNTLATPLWFWQELKKYCVELGVIFFSTPMSRGAAKILEEELDVPLWKVGSGDALDFVMLDYLAGTGKPIIIASGMSILEDIDKAIDFLKKRNCQIVLMHCVSAYPCPPEILNLNSIPFFQKRYDVLVGFSDHALGIAQELKAVEMGAVCLEKHFTLNRGLWGSDHQVSMLPDEMAELVKRVRVRERVDFPYLGKEEKILNEKEAVFRPIYRKALMAGRDIAAGEVLNKEDVYAMRPQKFAGGMPSEEYENVLAKKVISDLKKYDPITWENLI